MILFENLEFSLTVMRFMQAVLDEEVDIQTYRGWVIGLRPGEIAEA